MTPDGTAKTLRYRDCHERQPNGRLDAGLARVTGPQVAVLGMSTAIALVVGRMLVRRQRGLPLTRGEAQTSVAVIGIGVAVVVVFLSPGLVWWLPSVALLGFGLWLTLAGRRDPRSGRTMRWAGWLAIMVGAMGLLGVAAGAVARVASSS